MAIEILPGLRPRSDRRPLTNLRPKSRYTITVADPLPSVIPPDQLRLGQYELGGEFRFGTRTPFAVPNDFLVREFGVEQGELRTFDTERPDEDGTDFGIDYHGGMNLNWEINLWKKGKPALADLDRIVYAWQNKYRRSEPGMVVPLRMNKNGKTSVVYGRPRRCQPEYGMVERGWCPISLDFKCVDSSFYSDVQYTMEIEMANPPTSGLRTPFKTPLTISQRAPAFGAFTVGGTKETWPTFLIQGPIINPRVEIVNHFAFELNVALNSDDIISIDPRPWRRMTILNETLSRSGRYTSSSAILPEMLLPPGSYFAAFTGTDVTLSSRLTVGWRNANSTP